MSVYLRKGSKIYSYDFEFKGQRFRGSTGQTTAREAKAFEKAERERLAKEHATGRQLANNGPTIDEVFARYWTAEGHKKAGAKHNVYDHLAFAKKILGGDRPFASVTGADIAKVLEAYEEQGVSGASVNRRRGCLRRVHNYAREVWMMDVQQINWKVHTRKEAKERVRFISTDQAKVILDNLPHHVKLLVAWSLATGCRLGETKSVRWSRVNTQTRTAEVETKGGGTRFISLNADAIAVVMACKPRANDDFVFDMTNRRKHWEAALKKAKIADFRWHDLRHTYATWLGNSGAGLQVIQKALGHNQIGTTMKYLHTIQQDVARANQSLPPVLTIDASVAWPAGSDAIVKHGVPTESPHSRKSKTAKSLK